MALVILMNKTISVCFLALRSYSLLSNKNYVDVKGPDVQHVLLAKELIKLGYKVSFICYSNDMGSNSEYIDGIEIIKIRDNKESLNPLKKMFDSFKILLAIKKSNSDIYIHNGGILSIFPLLLNKKDILVVASDGLLDKNIITKKIKEFKKSRFDLDNIGTFFSIKMSKAITVQTDYQREMLKKKFGKEGNLIKNISQMEKISELDKKSLTVLWVGAMAEVKQPELFVELAKKIPDIKFQMIGGPSNDLVLYEKMKKLSQKLENFHFLGVVPFNEINQYYNDACLLVNTSLFEGFPNAFIQSWINQNPVVSLNSNPDGIISKYGMGFYLKNDFEQLIKATKYLLKNKELREKMGKNGRNYVEKEHNASIIVSKYIKLFDSILK